MSFIIPLIQYSKSWLGSSFLYLTQPSILTHQTVRTCNTILLISRLTRTKNRRTFVRNPPTLSFRFLCIVLRFFPFPAIFFFFFFAWTTSLTPFPILFHLFVQFSYPILHLTPTHSLICYHSIVQSPSLSVHLTSSFFSRFHPFTQPRLPFILFSDYLLHPLSLIHSSSFPRHPVHPPSAIHQASVILPTLAHSPSSVFYSTSCPHQPSYIHTSPSTPTRGPASQPASFSKVSNETRQLLFIFSPGSSHLLSSWNVGICSVSYGVGSDLKVEIE